MKLRNTFLTVAAATLMAMSVQGQNPNANSSLSNPKSKNAMGLKDGWSVGVNFGSLLFYGDIRQYDYYPVTEPQNERKWGYGLTVTKLISPILGFQGQILNGSLTGVKRGVKNKTTGSSTQGYYFNTDVFEYDVNAIINLSNISFSGNIRPRKLTLYSLVGFGVTNFRTQLYSLRTGKVVKRYGYDKNGGELPRTSEVVIPIGAGLKYRINKQFDVSLEATMRNVNSDKIDGRVVKTSAKDKYGYFNVGVGYKFDYAKEESSEWISPLNAMYNDLENVKTKVEGLTNDKDKDGVADIFDKDNNTHEGIKVYGDGTAVDTDMDGVSDVEDAEPFSSKGARVDANGREVDSDGDGVPDSRDLEANSAKGSLVNFQGVTIPTATVEASKPTGVFDITSAGFIPSIFFEMGSSKIEYKHLQNLAAIARILKTNPGVKLSIVGNADATGNIKNNEKLSKKRAEGVKEHLLNVYGIEASRLVADFKGSTDPLAKNEPKGGSLFNRRVDFKISK